LGKSLDAKAALIGFLSRMSSYVLRQLGDALKTLVAFVAGVRHLWHRFGTPFLVLLRRLPLVPGSPLASFGFHRLLLVAVALRKRWLLHKVCVGCRILAPGLQDAQVLAEPQIVVLAFLFEVESYSQPVNAIVADDRRQAIGFKHLQYLNILFLIFKLLI